MCARCGGKLEFDETPESYFSFVSKYAAVEHPAGRGAAARGARAVHRGRRTAGEKPPKIIKLVHGSVTYFRIIGTIGSMFRARPFLVGAEGEVVIDLAEVDRFDAAGQSEWKRLLKSLAAQVPAVTLVDVNESFLATRRRHARDRPQHRGRRRCSCRTAASTAAATSHESQSLGAAGRSQFGEHVCPTCGGDTRQPSSPDDAARAAAEGQHERASASAKLIEQRDEILSRALTDANVAQAGDAATAALGADDTILGKYKIVRRLSAGGMAEVFLAKQVGIGGFEKPVALKRIQRQLLESRHLAIDMFLNEAKIAGPPDAPEHRAGARRRRGRRRALPRDGVRPRQGPARRHQEAARQGRTRCRSARPATSCARSRRRSITRTGRRT